MPRKKKVTPPAVPTPVQSETLREFNGSDHPSTQSRPAFKRSWWSLKLDDRRWQEKRNGILQRDRYICQMCGDEEDTSQLQVHHRYYRFRADPWDYPDEALITLCKGCHKEVSEYNATFDSTLKTYIRPGDLLDYAQIFHYFQKAGVPAEILLIALQQLYVDPDCLPNLVREQLDMAEAAGAVRLPRIIRSWLGSTAAKEFADAIS